MSIDFTDFFCGGGGSAEGLKRTRRFRLATAINHDPASIRTHHANNPAAAHLCVDTTTLDMRTLPQTRAAWGSPICTENTPNGGNPGKRSKRTDGQIPLDSIGHRAQRGFDHTRATFGDIMRATEVHHYEMIFIENVPDVIWRWELLDWWCLGFTSFMRPRYRLTVVSADSAHLSGPDFEAVPQHRRRLYLLLVREDIPEPELSVQARGWCPRCEEDVQAVQRFKPTAAHILGQPAGKYGPQYTYVCPKRHAEVKPYTRGIGDVIDWTNRGDDLGGQLPGLATSTTRQIREGWASGRAEATRTGRPIEPYIVTLRNNAHAHPVSQPIATLNAGGNHHYLVTPPTGDLSDRLEGCGYRMLTLRERAAAQGFPADYVWTGSDDDQRRQIGNAVSVNAAHWLGSRVAAVL